MVHFMAYALHNLTRTLSLCEKFNYSIQGYFIYGMFLNTGTTLLDAKSEIEISRGKADSCINQRVYV